MYKKSNFNVIVETMEDGSNLVFNTMTCVLGVMDLKTQGIYEGIESLDTAKIDGEIKETVNTMLGTGFIVPDDCNEYDVLKAKDAIGRFSEFADLLTLTIATSLNCNMACTYCYEGKTELNKIDMSEEVQADVFEFVKRHFESRSIKRLQIMWYGGEPLLNKGAIYNLSEKFKALCKKHQAHYMADIVTNGILLDGETARKLKEECNVATAQITIDGTKEQHDKKRVYLHGDSSFDIIVDNIGASREYLGIILRMNVDKDNVDSVDALKKDFADRSWEGNPHFAPSRIRDDGNCNYDTSCVLTSEDFAKFETKQIETSYAADERNITKVYPARKNYFCGAQRLNSFVIDPEGRLYNCWNDVGIHDKSFGDVKKGYNLNRNYTKWLLSTPPPKCTDCQFLPICQGGCPYHYVDGGEPQCLNWVSDYKSRLKLAYKDHVIKQDRREEVEGESA